MRLSKARHKAIPYRVDASETEGYSAIDESLLLREKRFKQEKHVLSIKEAQRSV